MSKVAKAGYVPNPKSKHYEFGGPIGALGVTLAVPFFTYWLAFACDENRCPEWPLSRFKEWHVNGYNQITSDPDWWKSLWSNQAALVYLYWYLWTVVCWAVLPGSWVQGSEMRDGNKLWYRMNGFNSLLATLTVVGGVTYLYGVEPLLYISDHWAELITASLAMSVVQAFVVHAMSYEKGVMLATGGNTSNGLYNWFIGRTLNPAIGCFDIKSHNELRPGLMLWVVIDLAWAAKQYSMIGRVTDGTILTVLFHTWYVVDSLYVEQAMLTTMDITSDGFGFMLAVGDLTWVPFTYSYSARYVALHPKDLGVAGIVAVLGVQFLGYWIFRDSNLEKNNFRQGRNPKNLSYLQTERGTKLLTSGWWGVSRHPNYLGDWLMSWAWCLPAGFDSPLPYFYPIYFAVLLVHRQMRDDEACEGKYGKDWAKYKKIVPWRIIPYVY